MTRAVGGVGVFDLYEDRDESYCAILDVYLNFGLGLLTQKLHRTICLHLTPNAHLQCPNPSQCTHFFPHTPKTLTLTTYQLT